MLYVHRNMGQCLGIHVYDSSIMGSIKSFVILKCLAYLATYDIHSNMISYVRAITFLLAVLKTL